MGRNAVVNVQRGLESSSYSTKLAQKRINHHGGMKVIEVVYDDIDDAANRSTLGRFCVGERLYSCED